MDFNLDYNSRRAAEARFYHSFGRFLPIPCLILAIAMSVLAVTLFLLGESVSWFFLGLGLWMLFPYYWIKRGLEPLTPPHSPRSINDLLAGEVLALLPPNPTPRSIAESLVKSSGGKFFTGRFGIRIEEIAQVTPDDPSLLPSVWQEAINMRDYMNEKGPDISSTMVIAAIIRLNPAVDDILHNLRIDRDDIYIGASWWERTASLVEKEKEPRLTGGFARDWSFGYIPTLEHFGSNLSLKYSAGARPSASHVPEVRQRILEMAKIMSSSARRNIALIGPYGAGKSTTVEALADYLMDAEEHAPESIKFNQIFMLDASSIVSVANGRGEIERLVNLLMSEAYRAKNIILFLDNAELFFEDATGAVDLTNILQPVLEGGGLKIILAMDEQRFLKIVQSKPALGNSLNRIDVKGTSESDTIMILQDYVIPIEYHGGCFFGYQSLKEAYRLSNRYINDVAQPRASIQLLENAVQQAEGGMVTPASVANTIEKTMGIKVGGDITYSDSAEERQKLLNLEDLIHERMINQVNAVKAVASALRRARAGVRNENRPIGTFLFLGPTGVGKTELAKTLADVYFGGEGHMVRIDLNEYVRPDDVARLIANGATDAMSLSAQVQKNPFSVVLLDEIEKAHANVLTTLLQVLDEGILRDINNREISFRDTILIATSNAGADRIRQYIEAGYQIEQFSQQIQDEIISSGQFKPEFLNRFDEIAVFRPLTKDELLQVIDLILAGINKTLANQKVMVAVDEAGKRLLVDAGYDPRLGARPMRRIVQRSVENIVAEKMLTGELVAGSGIMLTADDIRESLAQ